MNEIITTKWLSENLDNKNLVIFDCSYFLTSEKKNPQKDYKEKHIKGAHFFNIEKISERKSNFPNMAPDLKYFKKKIKNFNIHKKSKIITYGSENLIGPSRVWWMFKYFGFDNVHVLNGGLSKWIKEKKPTTNKKSDINLSTYNFLIDDTWLVNKNVIIQNLQNKNMLIFDARNKKRFSGEEKEPRKNLKLGHIPYSKNIFWKNLTNKGEIILSKSLIKVRFEKYNVKNKYIIFSCGSGISACVLSLSLMYALGIKSSVYDGSWAEWGSLKFLPIEK
jgi:thiosulfate/3-mercaptopyruvate sulfurtransferase